MGLSQTYHETWDCPACGQPVEIESTSPTMKARGFWMPPSRRELMAVCAAQHHSHRRDGSPLPPPPPPDPGARWRPVVRQGDVCIVLVPPAGVAVRPSGDDYEVVDLPHLEPSDLVGSWDRLLSAGRVVARVTADRVRFDDDGGMLDWDALGVGLS